jgi:hypothetical protein
MEQGYFWPRSLIVKALKRLMRHQILYLCEDVFHGHDESLSVVEAEFILRVTAAREHAADVRQKHGAVHPAEHVPDDHRLLNGQFLWLAA